MITPLETYFVYEAGRPRRRAEQLAEDARAAELVAGFAHAQAALTALGRRLRRPRRPRSAAEGERAVA
ncbi:MAG: hypothetical protein M3Q31_06925 [Actinomycetota bacterium]|nr:hypothetical protein [Actinomycetota bacterium]